MNKLKNLIIHGSLVLPITLTLFYVTSIFSDIDYNSISSLKLYVNDNILTCLLCSTCWIYVFSASQIKQLKHEYFLALFIFGVSVFDMYNFELWHNISAGLYFTVSTYSSIKNSKTLQSKVLMSILNAVGWFWLVYAILTKIPYSYPEFVLVYTYSFFKISNINNILSNE